MASGPRPAESDPHLLDHVGTERAGVVGFSAGAPFTLACHRPDRIDHAAVVSGAGTPEVGRLGRAQRVMGQTARTVPWLLGTLCIAGSRALPGPTPV